MNEEERQKEVEEEWLRSEVKRRTPRMERILLWVMVITFVGFCAALIFWLSTNTLTSW